MKSISLSVMPTFWCTYNCSYCYLGNDRKDKTMLSIDILKQRFYELKQESFEIESIDIYGGNLCLLPISYIQQVIELCKSYSENVRVVTNIESTFSVLDLAINMNCAVGVSLNDERQIWRKTVSKLKELSQNVKYKIDILSVGLPSLLQVKPSKILSFLSQLSCIKSFSVLPYSPSVNNHSFNVSNQQLENFLIELVKEYKKNQHDFMLNLPDQSNPFMSHLYIKPNGQLAVLQYDENQLEYFYELSDIKEFYSMLNKELKEFSNCLSCSKYQQCCAEHLKQHNKDDVCCGLPNLIEFLNAY